MATLITYFPTSGPESIARLVWGASQEMLQAARAGDRHSAANIGQWLVNTREDPRCRPALAKTITHSLEIALQHCDGIAVSSTTPPAPTGGGAAA